EQNKITALLIHQNMSLHKKQEEELKSEYTNLLQQLRHLHTGFWSSNALLIETLNHHEQTERKLREGELRFHLLAENATDVISRHTPDGTYLYASPASKTCIGFCPDDLVGKNIYKFIHHDDLPKIKKAFTRRRENQNNKPIIYRIKRKEGEF